VKIIIFISLLLSPALSLAQNVSGSVQDFHFNAPLGEVSVTLKDHSNGEILGTDSTDASGNYSIDYIIISVNENNSVPDNYHLSNAYPNPFNPSARIDFSTPVQGKFIVRIFNVIGQLVYNKEFTIDAGSHSFNISGLGSAGVYLFNLSSDDFTSTQKLVQLDGGNTNTNVSLIASNHSRLKISAIDELLIEFRKDGYFEKDTVISWQMNLNVDAELDQIPQTGIALYTGHITTEPGGGNGIGLDVHLTNTENDTTLAEVVSNGLGNWETTFPFIFRTNGVDTSYNIQGVNINISGTGVNPVNKTVEPFAKQYNWNAVVNLITQFITATYNLHASNLQTGENVPNAVDAVRDQSNNLLFTFTTDANGNATKTYQNGYTVNGSDTLWTITQLNSTLSKNGYNTLQFSNPFQETLNLEKEMDKIPFVVNFTLNPWNILGFMVNDPVMQTISQDSTRTHTVGADGKIHFNYTLFNDVVEKDVKLVQTNPGYNPYLTVRRNNQAPDQLNIAENTITEIGGGYNALPDTLIINLDNLNAEGNANLFLDPSHVYHPVVGYISTMSDTIRSYLESPYPGKNGTTRWSTINTPDSAVQIFYMTWEENSGNTVPPDQSAQVEEILDTILTYTIHPSGDVLMHYDRYTIDSLQDPNWINATQSGFSNIIYTRHKNQTPNNFVQVNATSGFSEFAFSGYAVGVSRFLKADEMLSSFIAVDDNIHGSSIGVSFNSDLSINDLGKYIIYKMWMSNPKRKHKGPS
jgi:hypothetical protein